MSEPQQRYLPEHEFRRLSPLTPVVRAPIVVLAFVGGSWQQLLDGEGVGTTALIILGLLAAGVLYGLASWIRTKYWIDDDELRVDKGVVARQSRRIRIDRLQGVDIVQPFLARLFGLAELRFDVASGSDREGSLAFLPHQEALALRATLLRRRDLLREDPSSAAELPPAPAEAEPERELARLDLGLLLASLVLSTEALTGAVVLLAVGGVFLATGTFVFAGAMVPTALGFGLALAKKLTAYYGFRLSESPAGLHVSRGLTSLSSQTIALRRVQGLVLSEPWPWRLFGWARLEVSVAGYGNAAENDKAQPSSTLMPVAPREQCIALLDHVLGGSTVSSVVLSPPPSRAKWLSPLTFWWLAFGRDDRLVVSRRGFLVRRLDVVPLARVQSVRLEQGPVQRRLGLADLEVDSPPGPVRVQGHLRDGAEARARGQEVVLAGRVARRSGPPLPGPGNDPGL